jgi:hypothetical protein
MQWQCQLVVSFTISSGIKLTVSRMSWPLYWWEYGNGPHGCGVILNDRHGFSVYHLREMK